jgi:adenylate kinase
MANKVIIVTGTPGAGKTTLIARSKALAKIRYDDVTIGTLMEKIVKVKGWAKDRDEIRYLSNERITELRTATFSAIAGMEGNVVVDTHASIEQKGRYVPGLPATETMLLKEGLKAIVCVDSSTEDILTRRAADDKNRKREVEDSRLIDMQRTINLSSLSYYSLKLNIPLYVIDNKQGMLDTSVKRFVEVLEEVFK